MLAASEVIATIAVRPDKPAPLLADPEVGEVAAEATHTPGEGEAPTRVEDRGDGARGEATWGTLISLRLKALSNPQSLGICFGSS